MEACLFINDDLTIPGKELVVRAVLSGGPGGQHVNKVATRVILYWNVRRSNALTESQKHRIASALAHRISAEGELQVSASDHRSQHRNRQTVREKMAQLVQKALVIPEKRVPTKASRASKLRRLGAKQQRSQTKLLRRPPTRDE